MLARQGAHQVAQKSTMTGRLRRSASRSALPSSVFTENEGACRAWDASGANVSMAIVATKRSAGARRTVKLRKACIPGEPRRVSASVTSIGWKHDDSNRKARESDARHRDFSLI